MMRKMRRKKRKKKPVDGRDPLPMMQILPSLNTNPKPSPLYVHSTPLHPSLAHPHPYTSRNDDLFSLYSIADCQIFFQVPNGQIAITLTLPVQIRTDRWNQIIMDVLPPVHKGNRIQRLKYIESMKTKLNRADLSSFWLRFEFSASVRSHHHGSVKIKYPTSEMVEVPFVIIYFSRTLSLTLSLSHHRSSRL